MLFPALAAITGGYAQQTSFRVISYNVLHGFNNDPALKNRYVDWVKEMNPDVVTYQELNGFNQDSLEELGKRYGHLYAVINTGVTHPIGITSRYPIVLEQHVTTNMWHSYLYGNINGVHVFVTHLSPFEVKSRRADVDRILAHVKLLPAGEKLIITGDFNAFSPEDSLQYDSSLVRNMQRLEGRLEPKSGLPIVKGKTIYRNNMDDGRIDYTVIGKMLAAGLKDAFYLTNKQFRYSAPTKAHAGKRSIGHRIDYIWVNAAMAPQVLKTDIIWDKVTDTLSDHYPVMMDCRL